MSGENSAGIVQLPVLQHKSDLEHILNNTIVRLHDLARHEFGNKTVAQEKNHWFVKTRNLLVFADEHNQETTNEVNKDDEGMLALFVSQVVRNCWEFETNKVSAGLARVIVKPEALSQPDYDYLIKQLELLLERIRKFNF
ncbi:MAG: hypothetical protein WCW02_02050 [Candidatus Buchananbacteria bacterium]